MNTKMNFKAGLSAVAVAAASLLLSACGGGGHDHHSSDVLYYPYETVYGDICTTMEPTPGCTFSSTTGLRITVSEDRDYDKYGSGSDDMWFVTFNSSGVATVRDDLGNFKYFADVSSFAGWVGGNTIGVGTSGLFWEDIRNGTYWLGKNGVLYSANYLESNYGQAINNQSSSHATDTDFVAASSDTNKALVKKGAEKLMKEYGFKKDKATAVASALNARVLDLAKRGQISTRDVDTTFKATFGVQFADALAAVKDLAAGEKASMQALTNRSAAALGLKPAQAQKFMKGMYKKALSDWGYDAESFQW